jgi:2,3-dihydroxybenzoate-AMP ligase
LSGVTAATAAWSADDGRGGIAADAGSGTLRGYYRAAEHNARSSTADGWYRSGDI